MTPGTSPSRQTLSAGQCFARHRHAFPYAAVVLAGAYREAGSGGRFRVASGEAMFHDAFDAHLNCVEPTGAVILNIPLKCSPAQRAHFSVADVDAIAAIAERDPAAAGQELLNSLLEPLRAIGRLAGSAGSGSAAQCGNLAGALVGASRTHAAFAVARLSQRLWRNAEAVRARIQGARGFQADSNRCDAVVRHRRRGRICRSSAHDAHHRRTHRQPAIALARLSPRFTRTQCAENRTRRSSSAHRRFR